MNKKEVESILSIVEKAYRRGWQQGFSACKANPDIDADQVHRWRFDKNINKHIPAPESESFYNAKESCGTLSERYTMESTSIAEQNVAIKLCNALNKGK